MSLKLCGRYIRHEHKLADQSAANRIHSIAYEAIENNFIHYDNKSLAKMLEHLAESAEGIWRAVEKKRYVDVKNKGLDPIRVKCELLILTTDLSIIVNTIQSMFATGEGKKIWPEDTPCFPKNNISILDRLNFLLQMSFTFDRLSSQIEHKHGSKSIR